MSHSKKWSSGPASVRVSVRGDELHVFVLSRSMLVRPIPIIRVRSQLQIEQTVTALERAGLPVVNADAGAWRHESDDRSLLGHLLARLNARFGPIVDLGTTL